MTSIVSAVTQFFRQNIAQPLRRMTPNERLLCVATGFVGGMFPLPMVTTVVTLAIIATLPFVIPPHLASLPTAGKAVATAINLLLAPLDILAVPYLAQLAALFSGADATRFTPSFLAGLMAEGLVPLLSGAASLLGHAVAAWLFLSAALFGVLVLVLRRHRRSGAVEWKN
jgi:hypothetical protein